MEDPGAYLRALIKLHRGLSRQGPGDESVSKEILSGLPEFPEKPRIADLGCGSGAGALLLAEWFGSRVLAVDLSEEFIGALAAEAQRRGLDHLVRPILADMGKLDWPAASLDLLWSEGAAYNLGFERALSSWRPLLAERGVAVVSELCWFTSRIPEPARAFWLTAYPGMGSESENAERARRSGFEVLATHRLSNEAWWDNYYTPLARRIEILRLIAEGALQSVIRDTEAEMDLFRRHGDSYGYTFYVLEAGV
jgi:SAM-dependent methyltransferase